MNERIFTGYYDANGTPIYTGDILKWTNDDKQNRLIAVTVKDGVFYGTGQEVHKSCRWPTSSSAWIQDEYMR